MLLVGVFIYTCLCKLLCFCDVRLIVLFVYRFISFSCFKDQNVRKEAVLDRGAQGQPGPPESQSAKSLLWANTCKAGWGQAPS